MEGTKPRTVSSLGMFDLLKGIGMLAIVFAHTAELYPLGTNDVIPFAFALFAYREALMAAFFIASGYRKACPAATASASAPSTNASSSSSRPCSSLTFILHWPPRCSTLSFTTQLSARGMPPSQNRPRS